MLIKLYQDEDEPSWNGYVNESSSSECYHQVGWKDVIERSFGHKTFYLMAESREGKVNGLLPLVHIKSVLFGNYMASMPYFNYGGVCADDEETRNQLLGEAVRIASKEGAEHLELRHTVNLEGELQVKTSKVSMHLSLPSTSEELWKSLSSKLRSQVKRPEKEKMYVQIGREDELGSFYNVFCQNMRDLGTPVYPVRFFRNILDRFPQSTWIASVYKDSKPVASGFLVGFKNRMEIPWASALREFNRISVNMLLYWEVLKYSIEQGYEQFDFGRSTPGEGTYRFKKQWGAKPHQLYWNYWLKNGGPLPEGNPHNPKNKLAITLWRKLPLSVTKMIGPLIAKNLP